MIAVGGLLAFAAAVANAVAVVLQASEARQSPARRAARFSLLAWLVHRPRWLLGTGLLILAWPLQVLALTFAPITLVQPVLATFQLVLLLLARLKLREPVGRREVLAALALTVGIGLVVAAVPRHTDLEPRALRLALLLAVVGCAALLAYGISRVRSRGGLLLVIGAGLGYAWVDFADKLLSDAISGHHWIRVAVWLPAILGFGALAFLQENTALQRRPAVGVAPVIGAIQDPLPVLMALVTGAEAWSSDPLKITALAAGLALVVGGASILGRSRAVATVSATADS